MKLLAFLTVILWALSGPSARAGDAAELAILGFSPDGSIFAFEEYGVQDGSGFPYANRFYIDVTTDKFVKGSPIRVRLDDENASLDDARADAAKRGQAIVSDAALSANRGQTVALNPITERSADPHLVVANPRPVLPPIDDPLAFRLEELQLAPPANCETIGGNIGYRLLRMGMAAGESAMLLHEDSKIPSSRGCPLGYRIGAVQTFFPESGSPVFAVLIAVRSYGFEGPDHRWIAVPGRL